MRTGLKTGQTAEIEIVVDNCMQAAFEGQTVHELYSTSSLVNHMELAARKTILPYLEADEEGMGSHIEVSHLMLTLPGMKVRLIAEVTEVRDNKVVCDVEAFNIRGKIARGTVTQSIVRRDWLDLKMKEMAVLLHVAPDAEPFARHKQPTA